MQNMNNEARRNRATENEVASLSKNKKKAKKNILVNKFGEEIPAMITGSDFSKAMDWSTSKFSNYLYRGIVPEPSFYIGRYPYWSITRAEEWINKNQDIKGSGRGYGLKKTK